MVRTVKIVGVLSANSDEKSTPESHEKKKSTDSPSRRRLFIRVTKPNSGILQQVSSTGTVPIPSDERATHGNNDPKKSTGIVRESDSNVIKAAGTPSNGSRKTGRVTLPLKRRQAIVSLQNGGKGITMNIVGASASCHDSAKKVNENKHNDSSKVSSHCYPPNEHTALLLKLLSSGEILSYEELDEIVSYVGYLKSRKLVTDHLLKKKIISLIAEPQECQPEALDDEPDPLDYEPTAVTNKVNIPVLPIKRRIYSSQDSVPSKMPRLLEILQSNDSSPASKIAKRHSSVRPIRETPVACDMCGSRVQLNHLKMHHKVCKGILIQKPRTGPDGSPSNAEEKRPRTCPRCEKTLPCNSDFEMHMAVAHNFYWRFEFDNEEEFKAWFREEGLDETMYVATCQRNQNYYQKIYYCAINRNHSPDVKKCPCRLVMKKMPNCVIVRYLILHNHTERYVRHVMSVECRDMIVKLLKEGCSNYEIMKKVKETYPKTSMNYHVTRESITRLRYRYLRSKTRKKGPLRKTRRVKKVSDEDVHQKKRKEDSNVEETDLPFSDDKHESFISELSNTEVPPDVEDVNDCSVVESENF